MKNLIIHPEISISDAMSKSSAEERGWRLLSVLLVIFTAIASATGLFFDEIYRDIPRHKAAWISNDVVSLFAVVPLYLLALGSSFRGNLRSRILLLGLQLYLLYNYAYYLFGAEFNALFLLYTLIFTASIYALILGVRNLKVSSLKPRLSGSAYNWLVIGFMFFIAVPLLLVEGGQALSFIFTGKEPEVPSLIFALDLSLVVPASILAGILLWQKKLWGYFLASLMSIKAFTYGLVLVVMTLYTGWILEMEKDPLLPFYSIVCLGGILSSWFLLSRIKPTRPE